ncbi:MAG: hypothetical protein DSY82_01835 [Flavobacteriia bacterium]|nr:MAG: hypothetical protein DSY82_01835 [Flavobacteriia bacterium]
MKLIKKITIVLFLLLSLNTFAQKEINEGMISMKITMSSDNDQINSSLAMLGDMKTTTYFKGKKSVTLLSNPMSGSTSTIIDNDKKEMLLLMDNPMMGKKYKKTPIESSEEDMKNITVKETGDTKTILGYKCKGYDVTINKNGTESKMTMYVTDKVTAPNQQNWTLNKNIKGFPLYLTVNAKQGAFNITTTMEATEIKSEKVDNSKFDMTIPEGYTEMTN